MEAQDIPAFQVEDDMPPESRHEVSRVDFHLQPEDGFEREPDKFWKKQGKKMNDKVESS